MEEIIKKVIFISLILLGILMVGILFKDINVGEVFSTGKDRFISPNNYNTPTTEQIIIDKNTRVMYLWCESGYKGGLTVMLNPEGKPLLYEGELEE
jgi:hypothetical protein